MRSLHLVKTSSGAHWAFRLMRDLVEMGEEVHVAMPLNGIRVPQYLEAGIIVHELNYSIKGALHSINKLKSIVSEVKPDIIHSHFVITTLLMRFALRKVKIPRVFEVAGPLHLEHFIYRNADILTAQKNIDYWIPTCKWSYNKYIKCGISENRLLLTYYGGDLICQQIEKGKLRKELGLKDDDIIVGMVAYMYAPKKYLGQIRGIKGHEDLIDAVALIQDKYPNLHLVLVGGAWNGAVEYERKVIEYGTKKCKNIHFLGTRKDVPELYQDFNMVVHPSHSENLGGAGESLRFRVPTIATKIGGFPDVVIPGKTGILVEPNNPQDIAESIEYMINHPKESKLLAKQGQEFVYELLNSKNTSKKIFSFYRKITNHQL